MVWQDRDYNRGGYGDAGDFLANPAALLNFSVPFGNWFGVRVRLHFWLLFWFVLLLVQLMHGASPLVVAADMALMLAALLMHDFGHKAFATWAGGELNEFMLWPAGGMIFPQVPAGLSRTFIAFIGGITVNLILAVASFIGFYVLTGATLGIPISDPVALLGGGPIATSVASRLDLPATLAANFAFINLSLVVINLLPYFWFDGGFLWRSVLTPLAGAVTALNVTCIAGMLLAAAMFFLSLSRFDLFAMVFWGLLFSSAYTARTHMAFDDFAEGYAGSYANSGASARIKSGRWPSKAALRAQAKRRREDQKIDEILAKVSAQGMHSLTWLEKRTLRRGSKRLR